MADEETLFVYVIALIYYEKYVPNLLRSLKLLGNLYNLHKIMVVINNPSIASPQIDAAMQGLAPQIEHVDHDNAGGEFGAYQLGMDRLRQELRPNTCLIVLNETMGVHFPFETEHADGFMRSLLDRRYPGRVVGHIDHFERHLGIDDCRSSRWVRSNLVGFDFDAISSINFRIYVPHLQSYIVETDVVAEFFSEKLDPFLRDYMADWLFSGTGWYGAAPLSKSNARSLAFKARSILQENYLSMRLEQHQVAFLPFNYTPAAQITRRAKHGVRRILKAVGATKPPRRS